MAKIFRSDSSGSQTGTPVAFDKVSYFPGSSKKKSWERTDSFVEAIGKRMGNGVAKVAFAAQRDIRKSLNIPGPVKDRLGTKTRKTGDIVGNKKKFVVRRSKPGEPPRYNTKDLMNSIVAEETKPGTWRVGSPMKYALALEFGYEPRNLEARPFLRPVMRKNKAKYKDIIFSEVKKVVA